MVARWRSLAKYRTRIFFRSRCGRWAFSAGDTSPQDIRDRQLAQGFLVGAGICSVLVFTRLVSGNASFSTLDVLVLSFAVVGALGGALRGLERTPR